MTSSTGGNSASFDSGSYGSYDSSSDDTSSAVDDSYSDDADDAEVAAPGAEHSSSPEQDERSEARQRELQDAHNLGEKEAAEGHDHRTINSEGSIIARSLFDPFHGPKIEKEAREDNEAYTKGWENARKQQK